MFKQINSETILTGILLLNIVMLLVTSLYLFQEGIVSQFFIFTFILLSFSLSIGLWMLRLHFLDLKRIIRQTEEVARNSREKVQVKNLTLLQPLTEAVNQLSGKIKLATQFARSIGQGKLDVLTQEHKQLDDQLINVLIEMRDQLKRISAEEKQQKWLVNGRMEVGDILRTRQQDGIENLSYAFLSKVCRYAEFNIGALYLIDDQAAPPVINLVVAYSNGRQKHLQKSFPLRQGLVGQCIFEENTLRINNVPSGYLDISTGLGKAAPSHLLVVPINNTGSSTIGAVELGCFSPIPDYKLNFIETVCERLAATLSTMQMNQNTRRLLQEATNFNDELRTKEELMRQNAEELTITQEQLNHKLRELEGETNLIKYVLEAINKTNAYVEFDFEGNILDANQMYLRVMGYQLNELKGQNEKMLLMNEEAKSERYALIWESLKAGNHISGEYRRISKEGREVWLSGTYNPIFDIDGKPQKVIQLTQFTTEDKEKDLDFSSKINAINQSLPVLELNPDGDIRWTSSEMMKLLRYEKRKDLIGKKLSEIIDNPVEFEYNWIKVLQGESRSFVIALKQQAQEHSMAYTVASLTPLRNLAGKIHKVLVILVDISEQKYLEQELIVNQKTMREMILRLEESQRTLQKQKEEEARRLQSLLNKEKLKNQILSKRQENTQEAAFMEYIDQTLARLTRSGSKIAPELVADQENIAVAYMDSEGQILSLNLQFAGQFGYLREELIGRNFASILAAGNVKQRTILERLLRGDVVRTVFTYINKDGRLKDVLSVSMPIFDDQMKIIVFLPEAINIANI